jgi:hypothetical protein
MVACFMISRAYIHINKSYFFIYMFPHRHCLKSLAIEFFKYRILQSIIMIKLTLSILTIHCFLPFTILMYIVISILFKNSLSTFLKIILGDNWYNSRQYMIHSYSFILYFVYYINLSSLPSYIPLLCLNDTVSSCYTPPQHSKYWVIKFQKK